jgi:uncharacterized membrane protein YfcA
VDLSPWVIAGVVAVGFASGVLGGMVGVGGAVLTTPGIRFLGATPIEAVGSTLPAILPTAISGTVRYARAGLVEWRVAAVTGTLGTAFAIAGALASDYVNGNVLMLMTAALLFGGAARTLVAPKEQPVAQGASVGAGSGAAAGPAPPTEPDTAEVAPPAPRHSFAKIAFVGCGAGTLSGLLGVGGGIVMVPGFNHLLRMPMKRAVATSLIGVATFSIPATIAHALLGHIHWGYALALTAGTVPGAQLGAHITIGGSDNRLRLIMGIVFTVLALVYAAREITALVGGS